MSNSKIAPLEIILSAEKQKKKGRHPSLTYKGERNPRKALALAHFDYQKENKMPFISDHTIASLMKRIKFVRRAMVGIDGKPYTTDETDKKFFDLFYVKSATNPRTQAFNFDQNSKLTEKATGLKEICKNDIFVKIGGYYGFCKITMCEVFSQIPKNIISDVVAFALDPENSPKILNSDFQSASIIFYGKSDSVEEKESLPSAKGLIKQIDFKKVERLKNQIKPIIKWKDEGFTFIEPKNATEIFAAIGIWTRINGSNLHWHGKESPVNVPHKKTKKVSVYQEFKDDADSVELDYDYTISQIPDELINQKTIGLLYHSTDYFKTEEGIIHKTEYTLIEEV